MKIAVLSDTHNNWNALDTAVASRLAVECEVALFAGDLTRPKGVRKLAAFPGPVHMIVGNMDANIDSIWGRAKATDNVIFHGEVCDIERSGVRIFMHHHPGPAEKRSHKNQYDLCVHGHLHEFRHQENSGTHLINPGALTRRGSRPEWAVFDAQAQDVNRRYPGN